MTYLDSRWGVGPVTATDDVMHLYDDGIASTSLVAYTDIAGATEVREQGDIIHDPNDPNLGTNPEREYKHYFSALVSGTREIHVIFSADGSSWSSPTKCAMGGSDRESEDPGVCVQWSAANRGKVYRDGSDLMYLYCEDSATSDIYGYSSTDGITFTELGSNPVIARAASTWEAHLIGSPYAVHDGTNFIVGYEGINQPAPGATEAFGVASGATANSLTKSANNPVWAPSADPHASATIVVDSFFLNDAGTEVILQAHAGGPAGTTSMFRGITTVTDPTAWVSGDIETIAADVDEAQSLKNDFTVDHSDLSRIVTTDSADQNVVRYKLWGASRP